MPTSRIERSFDPFRKLAGDQRASHLREYQEFMRELDGDVDVSKRLLSRREKYFDLFVERPVASKKTVDKAALDANLRSAGESGIDEKTAWLVVAAKANSGESYGVDQELKWMQKSDGIPTADELYLRMLLQEGYHTRILIEVCRIAGVRMQTPLPNWNQRLLIQAIMRLPDGVRWTLVICGEIVGCAIFEVLLENCALFSDEPEVEERLRSLLMEILRDEVLHVAYLRAKLSPTALRVAQRLLPLIARAAMLDLPQLQALGTSKRELLARVRSRLEIPADVHWMEPDPAPALS